MIRSWSPPDGETFASVFARALERRHVSLSWLRDRLAGRGHRISLATLSYWRAGHRVPARLESLEALSEIETLLDVPEGSLAVLARDRRRPRPLPLAFDTVGFGVEDGNVVGEGNVVRVLFHMTVDVDRAQECIESTVTQLFVAARNGVTGVSMFVGPDADGEGNTSRVEAVSGCRLGPVEVREKGIESHWLDFERPCRAGESVLVQTKVIDTGPNVAHETNYGIVAEEKLEECDAPGAVPAGRRAVAVLGRVRGGRRRGRLGGRARGPDHGPPPSDGVRAGDLPGPL